MEVQSLSDEEMLGFARGMAIAILRSPQPMGGVLEPDLYFEESQDAICLAQQLIAEATGLVGTGDV
jgi:hypothetical protein